LNGASFNQAKLQGARLGCVDAVNHKGCTSLEHANFSGAQLRAATFSGANMRGVLGEDSQMQGALLDRVTLDDAWLRYAQLQGVDLEQATLRGANLIEAQLPGASLKSAGLDGADLRKTYLQGADLENASLRAADLVEVQLQGANLTGSDLQGASLNSANLQGARLDWTNFECALLEGAFIWRARGTPISVELAQLNGLDDKTTPWGNDNIMRGAFSVWSANLAKDIPPGPFRESAVARLASLGPQSPIDKQNSVDPEAWRPASSSPLEAKDGKIQLANSLAYLACSSNGAPYVARSLLYRVKGRITGDALVTFAAKLRETDPGCSGVEGFTAGDWHILNTLSPAH